MRALLGEDLALGERSLAAALSSAASSATTDSCPSSKGEARHVEVAVPADPQARPGAGQELGVADPVADLDQAGLAQAPLTGKRHRAAGARPLRHGSPGNDAEARDEGEDLDVPGADPIRPPTAWHTS